MNGRLIKYGALLLGTAVFNLLFVGDIGHSTLLAIGESFGTEWSFVALGGVWTLLLTLYAYFGFKMVQSLTNETEGRSRRGR